MERISETALAALYQKYAPAIYAHCRRMLQSQAAARDATQEAFIRVLTRGPGFPNDEDAPSLPVPRVDERLFESDP